MDRAVGLTKSGIEESSNERPLPSSLSGGGAFIRVQTKGSACPELAYLASKYND